MTRGTIRIGISGWRYAPWRGVFYPTRLPQRDELAWASRRLPSIELNGSFYSLQTPASFAAWRDATPDDFVFAVKGPRYLTHLLRLKDVRVPLANFLASGVLALGDKLGPLLWQFPERMTFDAARFDAFFQLLPRDTAAARERAAEHDERVPAADLGPDAPRALRHAVEIRHPSFATPEFVTLLRRYQIGLVVADTAGRWPLLEDVCSDFVYVRLHGDAELYASGYGDEALADWARRIEAWAAGGEVADARRASPEDPARAAARDVFCYFDNDVKVHAPYDAARLAHRLGVPVDLDGERPATPPDLPPPRRRAPGFAPSKR
jgi:uncharacterized protein YecE (DUF72 family)